MPSEQSGGEESRDENDTYESRRSPPECEECGEEINGECASRHGHPGSYCIDCVERYETRQKPLKEPYYSQVFGGENGG